MNKNFKSIISLILAIAMFNSFAVPTEAFSLFKSKETTDNGVGVKHSSLFGGRNVLPASSKVKNTSKTENVKPAVSQSHLPDKPNAHVNIKVKKLDPKKVQPKKKKITLKQRIKAALPEKEVPKNTVVAKTDRSLTSADVIMDRDANSYNQKRDKIKKKIEFRKAKKAAQKSAEKSAKESKETKVLDNVQNKKQFVGGEKQTVVKSADKKEESKTVESNDVKNVEKNVQEKPAVDKQKTDVSENQLKESDLKVNGQDVFTGTSKVEGSVSTNKIISVDDCVKMALENNPTILSQLLAKDVSKTRIAQAWSNYFPTLNANVSYSRNDMMVTNFKFPMQKYNMYNTPSVGFNQLLFDFGKTAASAGIAKKSYEAAVDTAQASINDIVYQVKSAYYNLLFLQQQQEVYEDSVLAYRLHLNQAEAYYRIGGKAKIDVTTAAYNLDNMKLTLITAKNSVETGFAQLNNAMGIPDMAQFSIKDRLDKRKYIVKFEDVLQTAYESRPELLAAKKKMEGSEILIKSSKVAFLPDVNGYGQFSQGGKTPGNDYGYQIGASISYTGLNLLLLKEQMDEAKLTFKKDQADYEVQKQKVYLDVKQAYIQLKNAQESIPVARSSMEMAKEQYDLAAGRYKAGLGDAIELKDAETTYRTARVQYYNTLMQYHISAANLERVIGAPLQASDELL